MYLEILLHQGNDIRRGSRGGRDPPCSRPPIFFSTNFVTIAKKKKIYRWEYSMDAMYLNLMFINPRPRPRAEGACCTRPSLTPPPPAKNPGSAPGYMVGITRLLYFYHRNSLLYTFRNSDPYNHTTYSVW